MKNQRIEEWDFKNMDSLSLNYHQKQWNDPKRSTIFFSNFINEKVKSSKNILDIGCGMGGSTFYISTLNPNCNFIGIDFIQQLVDSGNEFIRNTEQKNIKLIQDDWFNLKKYKNIDGVISLQTLSWLPEFEKPIEEIINKVNPNWICFSSLFYEGDISIKSEIFEHSINKTCIYNTYSIPQIDKFVRKFGFKIESILPFKIDIDIDKPTNLDRMSTYTIKTIENERVQLSGPLLMSWYFVMISKEISS